MKFSQSNLILCFGLIACCTLAEVHIDFLSTDDPDVIRLSELALTKLNEEKTDEEVFSLARVMLASKEDVEDILYRITLRMTRTDRTKLCYVEIREKPSLNKPEIDLSKCSSEPPGRVEDLPANDPYVSYITDFAMQEINKRKTRNEKYTINKLLGVTKQKDVVEIIRMTLQLKFGDEIITCNAEILDKTFHFIMMLTYEDCTKGGSSFSIATIPPNNDSGSINEDQNPSVNKNREDM